MNFKQSLIENQSIHLRADANDWREAVKLGADMLITSGAVEPSYYEAIIRSIEKLGPYVVIAPNFAMPHARPEDGVNRTAFSLVTLRKPVYFEGKVGPVDVFITLAGSSSDEHMEGLMQVTQILEEDDSETGINLDKFRVCRTNSDVYALIDEALAVKDI